MRRPGRHRAGIDCRGTAMVTVLMMMFALFFLSSILMDASSNYLNAWVTPNVRNARALYVAEGGAHLGLQWLRYSYGLPNSSYYFTVESGQILYNNEPVVLSASTDSDLNHPASYQDAEGTWRSGVLTSFQSTLTQKSLGKGNFDVKATLLGLNPQLWRLVSTGTVSGASKRVTVQIRRNPFNPDYALVTDGDLTIRGNSSVSGSVGSVHSNEDLVIDGNSVSITGIATATSTLTCTPGPCEPDWGGGQPAVELPSVIPSDFRQYATYELRSDGRIYCGQAGASVSCTPNAEITSGPLLTQWSFSGGDWRLSGNTAADGAFYIEGDVEVSGGPGTAATPWQTTLIATGDINVSGTPVMNRYTQDLLLVAGRDLVVSGNANTTYEGIMAAHEQLKISGNPQLNGFIFSENAENVSNTVLVDEISTVSGSPTITYNGQLGNNPFPGDLVIVSWMEG
ncbi:MAG: hypothetical protein HYY20_09470 [Candidatus Tectomicrobia bacterium]|uniref:Type 4 fimbrial biogenesis protein PilX N-terminal domain-containing protein n=1 Tax=Tectimicrobiota bacterium TaxID=2528274 RepID=A0A932CPU2_UNCTE|nr:hypothetical protein [Candidatus Tectomicrobia bacterium]